MNISETAAMRSSARVLLDHFENKPCDGDGVNKCIRCNAIFLAKAALESNELQRPTGNQLLEFLVNSGLYHARCAIDEGHGCVTSWSGNSEEQLSAFLKGAV